MNVSSLKDQLRSEGTTKRFADELQPNDDTDAYQAFSYGRVGLRSQLMICFVKCDGHHLVLPYADLRSITSSDPDKGFLLEFVGREITVEGTNLLICFRHLRNQRLAELIEIDRPSTMSQPADAPVVQKLVIRKPKSMISAPSASREE